MIRISNSEDAIRREYDRVASRYDRRWSYYIQATLGETLKRLDLQNSDRLLDIGCGTATLFQAIRVKYPSIGLVGVDISSEMLRVACKKSGRRAQFLAGKAQVLPLRSQNFDVVVSCISLLAATGDLSERNHQGLEAHRQSCDHGLVRRLPVLSRMRSVSEDR